MCDCGANAKLCECTARVLAAEPLAREIGRLRLYAPEIARAARPGQFVHMEAKGLFLRRPISLFDADAERGTIDLVIQRVGKGTAAILDLRSGDDAAVLGPLGTGFPAASGTCWLVGGGVGIAPLRFLARSLHDAGARVSALLGYRGAEFRYADADFAAHGDVEIATDDGAVGVRGNAVDLVRGRLARGERPDAVYACGPTPMLRALQGLCADSGLDAFASLEARMGCGVGACLTCNTAIRSGDAWTYRRVCADGPVFRLSEVMFDG